MIDFLKNEKILDQDYWDRMDRFYMMAENALCYWDLSDRDMNALRTVEAFICECSCQDKLKFRNLK